MTATAATLLDAIRTGDTPRFEETLKEHPELAAARDGEGVSLLLQALYHRRPEMAEGLATVRGEGELDLFEAVALGRAQRVEALLAEDPAAAGAFSPDGFPPLGLAAYFGRSRVVELLLARGADVGTPARNPTRVTPLHAAVAAGAMAVVERLLAAGADPDARQQGGYTPLMGAAAGGHGEILRALLAAGADPTLTSEDGKTARDLAAERGHPQLAELLG